MRLAELEKQRSYRLITDIVADLKSSAYGDIFTDFSDKGLDNLMDSMIVSRFNSYELREDQELEFADGILADVSISTYLMEKAIYIRQQLAYEAAEYNPIENYSQIEHEETTFDGGARSENGSFTKGQQQDTNQYGAQTNSMDYGSRLEVDTLGQRSTTNNIGQRSTTQSVGARSTTTVNGQRTTTTDVGARSRTTQSAPFESSNFYNEHKESDAASQDVSVNAAVTDTSSTAATQDTTAQAAATDTTTIGSVTDRIEHDTYTDTQLIGNHSDTLTSGSRSDTNSLSRSAYQDSTERELTRSGNIGIQTPSQMMALDRSYWDSNTWIRGLVLGIVALTCETWEAV